MRFFGYLLILLSTSLLYFSCKKENSYPSKYPYYFVGTIKGKEVRYEANDSTSYYKSYTASHPFTVPPDIAQYEGTTLWSLADVYRNQITVRIIKEFDHIPSLAERKAMWRAGNFNYGVGEMGSTGSSIVDGISVWYLDENMILWNSEAGPQNGSKFTVTEMWSSSTGTVFRAKFSCNLYDGNGNSIKVENGAISGKLFTP